MKESGLDSVAILVVVDTPNFAGAIVQVLRNCAPFPIRAAVTNSLEHALSFLKTTDVDLILIDAFLPDTTGTSSLCRLRQTSLVPAIAFARSLTVDVEAFLVKCGAQVVLPRDCFDAMTLVRAVCEVLGPRPLETPAMHVVEEPAEQRFAPCPATQDISCKGYGEPATIEIGTHIAGVARLQEILSEQREPTEPQKEQLRRLFKKFDSKNS